MNFEDKTLSCRDCGSDFMFTAGEQGFYLEKGLLNQPQRCHDCRATRRRDRPAEAIETRGPTSITCASCGREATVPFVPRLDRPVYCDDCFGARHTSMPSLPVSV
jgi:CxxC-x17-CxxC domain-containing protein